MQEIITDASTGEITVRDFSPEEVTAALASALQHKRSAAFLPRLEFCVALLRLNILPLDECKAAARGEWPATFASFVAAMAPSDAAEAEIRWAAAPTIYYSNAMLQALAMVKAGGDAQAAAALLDQIFAI